MEKVINKFKCLLGLHDWLYFRPKLYTLNHSQLKMEETEKLFRKCVNCKIQQKADKISSTQYKKVNWTTLK